MDVYALISGPIYAILIQIPTYVACSPLCILSSSLYKQFLGFQIDEQTVILIFTLLAICAISAFIIYQLILVRSHKSILFYKFVFYISLFNLLLLGVTYSLLKRHQPLEQLLAKLFTTLLIILIAQKSKIRVEQGQNVTCNICFEQTIHHDSIYLPCKHQFHEHCLLHWVIVKDICPVCLRKNN